MTSGPLIPDTWAIGLYAYVPDSITVNQPFISYEKILGADSGAIGEVGPRILGITNTPDIQTSTSEPARRDGNRFGFTRYRPRTVVIPVFLQTTSPRTAREERERIIAAFEPSVKRARLDVYLPADQPYVSGSTPAVESLRRLETMVYTDSTPIRLLKSNQRRYVFAMSFETIGNPHFSNTSSSGNLVISDTNTYTIVTQPKGTVATFPKFDLRGLNGGAVLEHRETGIQCEIQHTGDVVLDMDPENYSDDWQKVTTYSDFFEIPFHEEAHIDIRYTTAPIDPVSASMSWLPRWTQC